MVAMEMNSILGEHNSCHQGTHEGFDIIFIKSRLVLVFMH